MDIFWKDYLSPCLCLFLSVSLLHTQTHTHRVEVTLSRRDIGLSSTAKCRCYCWGGEMWASSLSWIDGLASAAVPRALSLSITVTTPHPAFFSRFLALSLPLSPCFFLDSCSLLPLFILPPLSVCLSSRSESEFFHSFCESHPNCVVLYQIIFSQHSFL